MWVQRFFASSIGKKYLMALTGLLLLLFLLVHAIGNAAIFFSSKAFQAYADALHSFPVVVTLFGIGLLLILSLHVFLGCQLFLINRKTTSSRYAVAPKQTKETIAPTTMIYTGGLIFLFIIIHVFGFGFGPDDVTISELVKERLSDFFYGLFYLFSFCVLALHLSHGFWSMLQTFGANHPRYNTGIAKLTIILPLLLLVFFGAIVLYFMSGIGADY